MTQINYDTDSIEEIWKFESENYDEKLSIAGDDRPDEVISGKFHDTDNDIIFYLKNNELHRTDGPAVISPDVIEWYKHDQKHRADGPAEIGVLSDDENTDKEYYDFYYNGEEALDNLETLPRKLLIAIIENQKE